MGVAQKPRSWPRWVNFTPALVGHFYIGGDTSAEVLATRLRAAGKCVRILVPIEPNGLENITKKGVDWLDVYNHSLAEFKHQVRECLKLDL